VSDVAPPAASDSPPVEEDQAPEAAAAEAPEETPVDKPVGRTAFRAAVVLAVVFFVGTVVAVIFAAQQHRQLQQSKDARAGVEQVASRMTSALLTYDYRDLDKTKQAVLGLATGKFRTDYDQNFGGLSSLFTTTKGQSTATVKDVFVSSIDHDTATAIVVFDERTQGTSGQHLNVDLYLRLSLVKVKGQWRVDDVTNLNFGVQPGAQSPPTTAPAK
jgi:Mce-associated membrane protein